MNNSKVVLCGSGKTYPAALVSKIREATTVRTIDECDLKGDTVEPKKDVGRGNSCLHQWWDDPWKDPVDIRIKRINKINKDKLRRTFKWSCSWKR